MKLGTERMMLHTYSLVRVLADRAMGYALPLEHFVRLAWKYAPDSMTIYMFRHLLEAPVDRGVSRGRLPTSDGSGSREERLPSLPEVYSTSGCGLVSFRGLRAAIGSISILEGSISG